MTRRILCSLLVVALVLAALPAIALARQSDGTTIKAFGNEFEIDTPEDWATGDLDNGNLVIDPYLGGGAILLADGVTEAAYTSCEIEMDPFEYLVMSWNADCPEGTWVEVTASVWLDRHQEWSTYLTWGRWSPFIKRSSHASYSTSEAPYVNISTDEFYVRGNPANGDTASKVKLRVILHRDDPSIESPVLWYLHGTVRITDVQPTKVFRDGLGDSIDDYTCEVEVPQYSQIVRSPNIAGVMCSAATAAMLINSVSQMEGAPLNVLAEEVAMGCMDFRNNSFGNWSFTMAAAGSYGYKSYVDYSTIEGIKRHLLSGYAVGASVAYSTDPSAPNYLENAYGSTPGHLIVLRGYTVIDGVEYFIANDAYNPSNETVRKLYRVDQFENCWSRNAIYVVKPGKQSGVGNHPVKRVQADLEEIEVGKYALKLDVFGANEPVVTPKANSSYGSRHGFIAYVTEPEVFSGSSPSRYSYINVASNDSDLLSIPDDVLEDPDFRLYVANQDAHCGKIFIVDKDSDVKYIVSTAINSTDYRVLEGEIGPGEKSIVWDETTVQEFLAGLEVRHAQIKLFGAGSDVTDAASFLSTPGKTEGALEEGDFVGVLAWDGVTFQKYTIRAGAALLPLNIYFEHDSVSLYHYQFPFTNTLHGYQGHGKITYTSSNTAVARVDENGVVTPWNVGSGVVITAHVESDGVYQAASASYTLSVLRGTVDRFHWGFIEPPRVGEVPSKVYIPSPEDEYQLFYFAANEPLITWTGQLEDGKFKEGEAYSVSIRLQTNDYPGGNSAYFYANPFTADMIVGLPKAGDRAGHSTITGVTVTRNNNYWLTVKIDYAPLRLPSVFGYAAVALDGNVSMSGNSSTTSAEPLEGDVYAAGDIILKGNAKVGGDALATGSVSLSGNARIAGSILDSVGALRFGVPTIEDCLREAGLSAADVESLIEDAKSLPEKRSAGSFTVPTGTVLGTKGTYSWVDGDLIISGNATVTLDGVLVVSGNVTVKGNARLVGKGVIISESPAAHAINVEGNGRVVEDGGSILTVAWSGGIKVTGNAVLAGGIVAAGDIVLAASATSKPAVDTVVPLAMSLGGDIEINGNGWLCARVCAPNGEIRAGGNAKVYGSLVGREVSLTGNVQVDYPASLRE
ncbi:MAG TPA: hypothetical protein GX500_08070 [Firmicutes bacterium]|nr:hypothetical protein [Candidatus Fermentithermobacillaceae bacterium]